MNELYYQYLMCLINITSCLQTNSLYGAETLAMTEKTVCYIRWNFLGHYVAVNRANDYFQAVSQELSDKFKHIQGLFCEMKFMYF